MGPAKRPPMERFRGFYVEADDGCWMWIGALNPNGYGAFWSGERTMVAHKWAYEALVEPVPPGLQIDHLCRVRACVNPRHLEAVTPQENVRRGRVSALRDTTWHDEAWRLWRAGLLASEIGERVDKHYSTVLRLVRDTPRQVVTLECTTCGSEFERRKRNACFCSRQCKDRSRWQGMVA